MILYRVPGDLESFVDPQRVFQRCWIIYWSYSRFLKLFGIHFLFQKGNHYILIDKPTLPISRLTQFPILLNIEALMPNLFHDIMHLSGLVPVIPNLPLLFCLLHYLLMPEKWPRIIRLNAQMGFNLLLILFSILGRFVLEKIYFCKFSNDLFSRNIVLEYNRWFWSSRG